MSEDKYFGRMNSPTSSSYIKGICGEEMEFYLEIMNGIIIDIKYYSEGCEGTRACASMAASMAFNRNIKEALSISAGEVIKRLEGLSEEHTHCAILAVMALYKAIADYLLQL